MTSAGLAAAPGSARNALPAPQALNTDSAGFSQTERRLLLATRGIGLGVIERIECAGVHSLQQLRDLGVDSLVDLICHGVGSYAWRNRRRALLRALTATAVLQPAVSD